MDSCWKNYTALLAAKKLKLRSIAGKLGIAEKEHLNEREELEKLDRVERCTVKITDVV